MNISDAYFGRRPTQKRQKCPEFLQLAGEFQVAKKKQYKSQSSPQAFVDLEMPESQRNLRARRPDPLLQEYIALLITNLSAPRPLDLQYITCRSRLAHHPHGGLVLPNRLVKAGWLRVWETAPRSISPTERHKLLYRHSRGGGWGMIITGTLRRPVTCRPRCAHYIRRKRSGGCQVPWGSGRHG